MPKPWFPLALAAGIGGAFALWFAMNDYERARYYTLIEGVPHSGFMMLGLFGKTGELQRVK